MTIVKTMIYKTLHIKLKIEQLDPTKNKGELMCSGRVKSSCSSSVVITSIVCTQHDTNHGITDDVQIIQIVYFL